MTAAEKRDAKRAQVYAAELQVRAAMEKAVHAGGIDFFGSMLPAPSERGFANLVEVEAYIGALLMHAEVLQKFGTLPVPRLRQGNGVETAYYSGDKREITLPASGWAWRELVVLHELAHHITGHAFSRVASHGEEFAAVYCHLISVQMGDSVALLMRAALHGQSLKIGVV